LHGQLTDPWVHELSACWKKNHRADVGRPCIVDLNEVTLVDKRGERVLRLLARDRARFQRATEIIHIGQAVVFYSGSVEYFRDMVFNCPTLAEAYKVVALDGPNKLL
jgi:hypothetical protein